MFSRDTDLAEVVELLCFLQVLIDCSLTLAKLLQPEATLHEAIWILASLVLVQDSGLERFPLGTHTLRVVLRAALHILSEPIDVLRQKESANRSPAGRDSSGSEICDSLLLVLELPEPSGMSSDVLRIVLLRDRIAICPADPVSGK